MGEAGTRPTLNDVLASGLGVVDVQRAFAVDLTALDGVDDPISVVGNAGARQCVPVVVVTVFKHSPRDVLRMKIVTCRKEENGEH